MARKNQKAPWEEEEEIIWVSKTELKKDMEDLQKLGEELASLKPSVLEKFPFSEDLADAIKIYNGLKMKLADVSFSTLANSCVLKIRNHCRQR